MATEPIVICSRKEFIGRAVFRVKPKPRSNAPNDRKDTMTYQEATKAWRKVGAAHATGQGETTMYADIVGIAACLQPQTVYNWAVRDEIDLKDILRRRDWNAALDGALSTV